MRDYILEKIDSKGRKSLSTSIRNSKKLQDDITNATPHLVNDESYSERCYHIVNNLDSKPTCPVCGIGELKFNHNSWGYNKCCSVQCAAKHPERIEKTKITNMKRYGVENVYQNEEIKKKIKETNLKNFGFEFNTQTPEFKEYCKRLNQERYGVDSYAQTEEFKEKSKKTCLEKYGADHISRSEWFKENSKIRNLEKYGVDHQFKSPEVRKKISNTIKERYGKSWYVETDEFREKFQKTSLEKYGTVYPLMSDEVKQKTENTCNEKYGAKSYFGSDTFKNWMLEKWGVDYPFHGKHSKYILPSGRVVKIQGYEKYALDLLLLTYTENELLIEDKDLRSHLGKINYFDPLKNKERQYMVDIYIIPENKVIEVKSSFTLFRDIEINLAKRNSCLEKGFIYEFWIFDQKKELIIL